MANQIKPCQNCSIQRAHGDSRSRLLRQESPRVAQRDWSIKRTVAKSRYSTNEFKVTGEQWFINRLVASVCFDKRARPQGWVIQLKKVKGKRLTVPSKRFKTRNWLVHQRDSRPWTDWSIKEAQGQKITSIKEAEDHGLNVESNRPKAKDQLLHRKRPRPGTTCCINGVQGWQN